MALFDKQWLQTERLKQYKGVAIVAIVVSFFFFELFLGGAFLYRAGYLPSMGSNKAVKIAVVKFDEVITSDYGTRFIEHIEKIKEDKSYKHILLLIESPGGSPSISHDLAIYLEKSRQEIPITFYVSVMAASGSYYVASVSDNIIASPNSVIGSIGVMMEPISAEKLAKDIGIETTTITAGKYKKPFSFTKAPDREAKQYLMDNLLTPVYKNFVSFVSKRRGIDYDEFESKYCQGRIFVASDVVGPLVDSLSTYYEVLSVIKQGLVKEYGTEDIGVVTSDAKAKANPFSVELGISLDKQELGRILTGGTELGLH